MDMLICRFCLTAVSAERHSAFCAEQVLALHVKTAHPDGAIQPSSDAIATPPGLKFIRVDISKSKSGKSGKNRAKPQLNPKSGMPESRRIAGITQDPSSVASKVMYRCAQCGFACTVFEDIVRHAKTEKHEINRCGYCRDADMFYRTFPSHESLLDVCLLISLYGVSFC